MKWRRIILVLFPVIISGLVCRAKEPATVVRIDPAKEHQVIRGFGVVGDTVVLPPQSITTLLGEAGK